MKNLDLISGIILFVGGVAVFLKSMSYPIGTFRTLIFILAGGRHCDGTTAQISFSHLPILTPGQAECEPSR